jgi:hypothetical protein
MPELDVSGAFLITIGHGAGPETEVAISANYEDGKPYEFPKSLKPEEMPVRIFIALSPMWGAWFIPLKIVAVIDQVHDEPGFCGVRVDHEWGEMPSLDDMKPATLGIVVDDGRDRGQGLACSCRLAEVATWWADRMPEKQTSSSS